MSNPPTINIALAFNHKLFRNALHSLIEKDQSLKITASVSSSIELLQALHQTEIDIVLFDNTIPILNSESAFRLLQTNCFTKVIVLSVDKDPAATDYVMPIASACLTNDCHIEELIATIKSVHAKGPSSSSKQRLKQPQFLINGESISKMNNDVSLSKRELEIVKLICLEKCNSEIADHLNVSLRTIENHRYKISKKIGAKNGIGFFIYSLINGHILFKM